MIKICEVLAQNVKEAKQLLKKHGEVTFIEWGDKYYPNIEDAPSIEFDGFGDGENYFEYIIKARYNKEKDRIEVLSTPHDEKKVKEDEWYDLIGYSRGISYFEVIEKIGDVLDKK